MRMIFCDVALLFRFTCIDDCLNMLEKCARLAGGLRP